MSSTQLRFKLPQTQQQTSDVYDDFSIDVVQTWLHELPHNNLGAKAKGFYDFFVELNRTQIDLQRRFELTEALLTPLYDVLEQVNSHFLQNSALSSDQKRKITFLMQAISLEYCNSYKLLIDEWSKNFKANKMNLIVCLFHLSMLYMDTLRKAYESQTNPPAGVWLEWHSLYQFALSHKIASKECETHEVFRLRHTTLENVYKHALLLSCSTPFRWSPKELKAIVYTLEPWAPLLTLKPHEETEVFIVDLAADMPPRYTHINYDKSTQCLYLHMAPIIERIELIKAFKHTQVASQPLSTQEEQLPQNVAIYLASAWSQVSQRGADRVNCEGTLQVLLGLNSIFDKVHGPLEESSPDASECHEESEGETILFDNLPQQNQNQMHHTQSCGFSSAALVNMSPSGFCIEFSDPLPKDLKAGQLIAIEPPSQPEALNLGIVRWIKHSQNQTIQCGIKLLCSQVVPIYCFFKEGQARHQGFKCVWVPSDPNFSSDHYLITPKLPSFKAGNAVLTEHQSDIHSIYLDTLAASTSSFHKFSISHQDAQKLPFLQNLHPQQIQDLWQNTDMSSP